MKRIGIMGGTFDPIHLGHLMLGRQAYEEYRLDLVWYMPSKTPPHKKDHKITSAEDRCAMIQTAIRDIPGFELSRYELMREGGNTYTADTLRLLKEDYPDTEFYFIVGADSIFEIEKWYHPEYVLSAVTFLAADREFEDTSRSLDTQIRHLTERYGANIYRLHCREFHVASEEIRTRIRQGADTGGLIPGEVYSYILAHHLYRHS